MQQFPPQCVWDDATNVYLWFSHVMSLSLKMIIFLRKLIFAEKATNVFGPYKGLPFLHLYTCERREKLVLKRERDICKFSCRGTLLFYEKSVMSFSLVHVHNLLLYIVLRYAISSKTPTTVLFQLHLSVDGKYVSTILMLLQQARTRFSETNNWRYLCAYFE